jgi:hypothetical protein
LAYSVEGGGPGLNIFLLNFNKQMLYEFALGDILLVWLNSDILLDVLLPLRRRCEI